MFRKIYPELSFSENFSENLDFRIFFYQNQDFAKILTNMEILSKTLTKIKIFRILFQDNLDFGKNSWFLSKWLWFFEKFQQNQNSRKSWLNSGSSTILTKFDVIFEIIDKNQGSSKLLNEMKIFENFDQSWDYLQILTSIEIFKFFLLRSK